MANRYNPSSIAPIKNKTIFLDTNVLIYLFGNGTPTNANWEDQYARLYTSLNNQDNRFVVDFVVIAEFVNRAIRFEYDNYLLEKHLTKNELSYKKYRDLPEGQEALKDIYLIVKNDVLATFEVVERSFSKSDLLMMCHVDSLDFLDKAIVEICEENDLILLTNDKDYKHSQIDILSCNRAIC